MKHKKIIAAAASCLILFAGCLATSVFAVAPYSDVKSSHWAYDAVSDMSDRNVVSGYPDGSFKPSDIVTYGEFIKMIVAALADKDPGPAQGTEADPKHWAQNYYDKAVEMELLTTHSIPASLLKYEIPRRHMAVIISRALEEADISQYGEILDTIKDVTENHPEEFEIVRVYGAGIISGYPDGTFKPDGTLSRAEAASVLQRFLEPEKRTLPDTSAAGEEDEEKPVKDDKYNFDELPIVKSGDISEIMTAEEVAKIFTGEPITTYAIVQDASLLNMELKEANGYKWVSLDRVNYDLGYPLLIRDGKVAEEMNVGWNSNGDRTCSIFYSKINYYNHETGERYDVLGDITTVDYIGFAPLTKGAPLVLFVSPFK